MSLAYILQGIAEVTGLKLTSSNDKAFAVRLANRAAKELYESTDLPGSIDEFTLAQPDADSQISLPYYLGDIRAVKSHNFKEKIELRDLRVAYGYYNWPEAWLKFRVIGPKTLNADPGDEAPLTFEVGAVETPNITVTISGKAEGKSSCVETLTIDSVSKLTATNWIGAPQSIVKSAVSTYDITIYNNDGDQVGFIPNNFLESRYIAIDVSQYFVADCLDILYKKRLPSFVNDTDEFICEGFDDAIVFKAVELWLSKQDKQQERALLYYHKCQQVVINRITSEGGGRQLELSFAPGPFVGLFPKDSYLLVKR